LRKERGCQRFLGALVDRNGDRLDAQAMAFTAEYLPDRRRRLGVT